MYQCGCEMLGSQQEKIFLGCAIHQPKPDMERFRALWCYIDGLETALREIADKPLRNSRDIANKALGRE